MESEQVRSDSTGRWAALSVPRPLRIGVALVAATVVVVFSAVGAQAAPGDLDPTFSGDGKQTTDLPLGLSAAAAVVLQPEDGKIVAVGTDLAHGSGVFAVARYNPNGTLDTSFSGDGKQRTEGFSGATGVAVQADGKIVAVGGTGGEGQAKDFALARYNTGGSLDTSFSGDGKQRTDFGGSDAARAVVLQADGKIVAVGGYGGGGRFA